MHIIDFFPKLDATQQAQFEQMMALYQDWNSKINLISRKDIDHLFEHHILHSALLAKAINFQPKAQILDLGTGGGFPGIPLAVLFPETDFVLVDSIGKKIRVVEDIAAQLGLKNVQAKHIRAEELKMSFDFVITRAVAPLYDLLRWTTKLYKKKHLHAMPNGLWALKGLAQIEEELKALGKGIYSEVYPLSDYCKDPFYETKGIVYVQA
jgi:16S rRNA (guanine527-N7)-methyltransferase